MKIHSLTKLTPVKRRQVYDDHYLRNQRICDLARKYLVSPSTIRKVLERGRLKDFSVHKSINKRFRTISYGLKRLAKVEKEIEERLKKQAKRYNKDYPGQMMHVDSKRLPHLSGETQREPTETLFIAIDDYSRELFAAILPTKDQWSSTTFLQQVLEECPYTIEEIYSDNGSEFKGLTHHTFVAMCADHQIRQRFTRPRTPRTNGKAERVIRTLMDMWYAKTEFRSRVHRKQELIRFVNFYNTVKPHAALNNKTPLEQLIHYFYPVTL